MCPGPGPLVLAWLGLGHATLPHTLQIMTGEVGKTSNTAEELLALKKYIAKCSQDQERLRDAIARNKEKDDFLLMHRCGRYSCGASAI